AQAVALGNRRSRRGVEWHRYRRFAVEELAAVGALARECRSLTRPTPKAIADPATFSAKQWRCFADPVAPQGCPVVCFSSGGASAASRSALRSAAFSSFFLCFSSVRARAALCRSARSRR